MNDEEVYQTKQSRSPVSGRDSVDCRTPRGQTPLFLAVEGGLMENASFLLQHGAQPDSQDQDQDSPLLVGEMTDVYHRIILNYA